LAIPTVVSKLLTAEHGGPILRADAPPAAKARERKSQPDERRIGGNLTSSSFVVRGNGPAGAEAVKEVDHNGRVINETKMQALGWLWRY
jgi:hypothetical protein